MKENILWCADGNICQLPKDVPIGAATGVTAIKLNNDLEVQSGKHIDVKDGAFYAGASRDTANYFNKNGLVIRNGEIRHAPGNKLCNSDGTTCVDVADIYASGQGQAKNDGRIYESGWGGFKAGYYDATGNLIDINEMNRDGIIIRRGRIRHAPGSNLCNSDGTQCVDVANLTNITKNEIRIKDWKLYQEGEDLVFEKVGKWKYYMSDSANSHRWVDWTSR